jgi:tRNA(Ile)-lysidine synthase TilS/MesJ
MDSNSRFTRWKEEHEGILRGLVERHVFLLFSGGKDSTVALDWLLRASKEFEFRFEAHAGAFPVHRYPRSERERLDGYWRQRGVHITWHFMDQAERDLDGAANPCLFCQHVRKGVLKHILEDAVADWEQLVLIVSYSLWDIVSYALEHLLSTVLSDAVQAEDQTTTHRFTEVAQRFYPLIRMKEGYTIFRPLLKCNADDIVETVAQKDLPVLSSPCRYRDFRPKRILEAYYEKMGLRFDYDQVIDFARRSLGLPDISAYTDLEKEEYLLRVF